MPTSSEEERFVEAGINALIQERDKARAEVEKLGQRIEKCEASNARLNSQAEYANRLRARAEEDRDKVEAEVERLREALETVLPLAEAEAKWSRDRGAGERVGEARAALHPSEEKGTPNGGEHCAPPGGPNNVCFRYPDGSCSSCGFPSEEKGE